VVELLSSHQTFFSKFILPPIWIGGTGLGLMKSGFGNARAWPVVFVGWIVASGFVYWSCARLKRVSIDEQFLYVSNYSNEIAIPFSDIGDVTQNLWINNQQVTIHFKVPNEFGGAIVFMPRFRFFPFGSTSGR